MKKSVKLLFPALFLFGMLFFYGCDQKADLEGDDKNTGSYSRVVETIDFALSTGCRWIYTVPAGKSFGLNLINSQEELTKHLSCASVSYSVDFKKYSLLLAYGDPLSKVHTVAYELIQTKENEYRLNVDIQLGADVYPEGWAISFLIPKIPQSTTIYLNREINKGNSDDCESPYMESIVGTWKLISISSGQGTLDCSGKNIIYDFKIDGKLIVNGNIPGDLAEGEHTYEYKKVNICLTCSPVSCMRINDDKDLFCEAFLRAGEMFIYGKKTENGKTLFWSKSFVKITDIENYPVEISFTEYSLAGSSCQWKNFQSDAVGSTVVVINSRKELENHIECAGGKDYPDIDFSAHTLLLACGVEAYFALPDYKNLQQTSAQNYVMKVNLRPSLAPVVTHWQVPIVVSKITDDSVIELIITRGP